MEKLAYVFPGQGAQYVGMGKTVHQQSIVARYTYEEASDISGVDVAALCFDGTAIQQNRLSNMQLIIVTTAVAMYRAMMERYAVNPQFVAGHSVGEFAALTCSGAVSFSDIIRILMVRGEMLQRAHDRKKGHMTIVENLSSDILARTLRELSQEHVWIACHNASDQNALSGDSAQLEVVERALKDLGGRLTPLLTSPPIHSALMSDEIHEFSQFISQFTFLSFRVPMISNVTGMPMSDTQRITDEMCKQLYMPVLWEKTLEQFDKYGITHCVELGPKALLTPLCSANGCNFMALCYGVKGDRDSLERLFAGSIALQNDRVTFVGRCLGIAVSTKNYNDDRCSYQSGVVDNYRRLKEYAAQEKAINMQDQRMVFYLLKDLLEAKRLSATEIKGHLRSLLDETCTMYSLKDLME